MKETYAQATILVQSNALAEKLKNLCFNQYEILDHAREARIVIAVPEYHGVFTWGKFGFALKAKFTFLKKNNNNE